MQPSLTPEQPRAPLSPEAYLDALLRLPQAYAPRVSRDGQWLAWTWYKSDPAPEVYAARTDGSAAPVRLTNTPENTTLVSWTPDSRAVLVAQDRGGNERTQLFRVNLDRPEVMVPLTEPEPSFYLRSGELHPNGRWLIYGANFDFETGREIEATWIYRHDLATGERRVLARPRMGGWLWTELSPAGAHILYPRYDLHPAGRQMWLVDVEGQADREILNFGPDVKTYASWFPDGQRAVVLVDTPTHRRLGVWHLADGTLRWLLDDPTRNIEEAYVPYRSDQIVIIEVEQARVKASVMDPGTGTETPVPAVAGNLLPLAPVGDGEWVGEYSHSRQPADVVRFSLAAPRPEAFVSLTRVWERTPLTPADLAPAEDFRWRSVDGLEIQGWLYRAQPPARGTIVSVHGGPTYHSSDAINSLIQFFIRQGFNVLDPNYRGSTGFGLAFREAIKVDGWGGREQDDIRTGIEALQAAGLAAPFKVGITGVSYGGYSSWCAITRCPPELVAAAAPVCGMTDLVVDYETTRPDLRRYSEEMLGGSPAQVPQRYRERSPIYYLNNIRGRLLIIQGLQDPNVTPENVRAVTAGLQAAGIEYQLLAFHDEGHGIARQANQKVLYQRLAQFFEEALGGGPVASESSPVQSSA